MNKIGEKANLKSFSAIGIFIVVNYRMIKFKNLDRKVKDFLGEFLEGKLYFIENDVFGT